MKLYFSGDYYNGRLGHLLGSQLLTFFYSPCNPKTLEPHKSIMLSLDQGNTVFLDSGAFSAFTQNKTIDIHLLTEYCIKHRDKHSLIAALDVIGDADASYKNYRWQREQGADVFPTFHYSEPFDFLETLVQEAPLIGLGGVAQLGSGPPLYEWLDACWDIIADEEGKPKVEVHGFALTGLQVIKRYPWTYVDSTSWVWTGAMGKLAYINGSELYAVSVTEENPTADKFDSPHWRYLDKGTQEFIRQLAIERGTTIEACIEHPLNRGFFNIPTFKQFEQYAPERLPQLRQATLF